MFDRVVLRGGGLGPAHFSIGQLAQALLFYGRVHMVLEERTLLSLSTSLGVDGLIEVLRRPDVSATVLPESGIGISQTFGGLEAHAWGFVRSVSPPEEDSPKVAKRFDFDSLNSSLVQRGVKARDATRLVAALEARSQIRSLENRKFVGANLPQAAKADALDRHYLNAAALALLKSALPASLIPPDVRIKAVDSDVGVYFFSNIPWQDLELKRASLSPGGRSLTPGSLAELLLSVRIDLALASHYGSDFQGSPIECELARNRFDLLWRRTLQNQHEIEQFAEIVLPDSPSVTEQIDSGLRTFEDFLRVLDRADRFKRWVQKAHPDRTLAQEYLAEVSRQDWIQGGPAKTLRYFLGLAANLPFVPTTVAVGAATADALVERIIRGWRPSQFIDETLKPFLK